MTNLELWMNHSELLVRFQFYYLYPECQASGNEAPLMTRPMPSLK